MHFFFFTTTTQREPLFPIKLVLLSVTCLVIPNNDFKTYISATSLLISKYDNYNDKAPYIVSSFSQWHRANVFAWLFTCLSHPSPYLTPDRINSPPFPRYTKKYFLKLKGPLLYEEGNTMCLLHQQIMLWYVFPQYFHRSRLKLTYKQIKTY